MDILLEEFEEGVRDYERGEVPEGWNVPALRGKSPYLSGWFWASEMEVGFNSVRGSDGEWLNYDEHSYDEDED